MSALGFTAISSTAIVTAFPSSAIESRVASQCVSRGQLLFVSPHRLTSSQLVPPDHIAPFSSSTKDSLKDWVATSLLAWLKCRDFSLCPSHAVLTRVGGALGEA